MIKTIKRKSLKLSVCILFAIIICVVLTPSLSLAGGTTDSDIAENIFVYANDINDDQILLKVIPLDTLKDMAHGSGGTSDNTYYGSFIDKYKTPTYLEGKGLTIPELLDYAIENTAVTDADFLTYGGEDKIYFTCSDGASISYTYDELLGVNRYYFPALYNYWDSEEVCVSDVDAVLESRESVPVYLATESKGGRVFAGTSGDNISSYVEANDGVVSGCLTDELTDEDSLRLIAPQTEDDIENSTATYSDIKKWVYKIRLKMDSTSPIESLGTISEPTCTYTLDGDTLTITMDPNADDEDKNVSIYYSTIGGYSTTPVNLYTEPIVIENYNINKPFTIGIMAVEEGYVSSPKIKASSDDYIYPGIDPSFTYDLSAEKDTFTVDSAFDLDISLSSDINYTFYGAEYRISVPSAFRVDSFNAGDDWEYGVVNDTDDNTIITFTYLDAVGSVVNGESQLPVATITLTPCTSGDYTINVMEAIVTRSDATAYSDISASDLHITVEDNGGGVTLGDLNSDGNINSLDAVLLAKYRAGLIALTEQQMDAADLNGDGNVNALDGVLLAKYRAGLISTFTAS